MVVRKIGPGKRQHLSDVTLGFPNGWFYKQPIKTPGGDRLTVARRWKYQEEFVFLLYELAPGFLHLVHERIYPVFLATVELLADSQAATIYLKDQIPPLTIWDENAPGGIRRVPLPSKTARITWQDLTAPIPELLALSEAIQDVTAPHSLWVEWLVDFVLNLMAARHSDLLVDYRDPTLRSPHISPLSKSNHPSEIVGWDTLTFDFQYEIDRVAELTFEALQEMLLAQVLDDLNERREEHRQLREANRRLKLTEKKRRQHVSWLIQHIVLGLRFTEIADQTLEDESTIRKGVAATAKELGLTIPRLGRGGKRK